MLTIYQLKYHIACFKQCLDGVCCFCEQINKWKINVYLMEFYYLEIIILKSGLLLTSLYIYTPPYRMTN